MKPVGNLATTVHDAVAKASSIDWYLLLAAIRAVHILALIVSR